MPLNIYFLNVGHGDSTFIEHPSGHLTMIDVNNSKSLPELDKIALAARHGMDRVAFKAGGLFAKSLEDRYKELLVDPYDFYSDHFAGRSIFRYIQTHPDLDHMSGLCRFFWQEEVDLLNFWDTTHSKDHSEDDFENCPYDHNDWLTYKLLQAGRRKEGTHHKVLRFNTGATGDYYTGDGISILSPSVYLQGVCDADGKRNNLSYVLRVEHAGRRVILPGDAGAPAWDSVVTNIEEANLQCDVLKAAHHGRESGYHEEAVNLMDPDYVICSVGKQPSTDASDEYEDQGASVLSTRDHGTIHLKVWDDGDIWLYNHAEEKIAEL